MDEKDGTVYYFPPIRGFKDTGFVTHGFGNGASVTARVVQSGDSGGFAIELTIKGEDGKDVCCFTMDRFAALCLVDCINKNLLNQEELIENEYYNKNQFTVSRLRDAGGTNKEGGVMG